jgi:hypothetical protein
MHLQISDLALSNWQSWWGFYPAHTGEPPITVIIGGRALLMLIAARFSGSGSGKDLLSRATSLIAFGLLPFSSFPIPVAPDAYRGRDRPACRNPMCSKRDGAQGAAAVRSGTRNLARASLVALSSIEGLFFDRSAL